MSVRNISKKVKGYMKIHWKHIGKTIVVHNLYAIHLITMPMASSSSDFEETMIMINWQLNSK